MVVWTTPTTKISKNSFQLLYVNNYNKKNYLRNIDDLAGGFWKLKWGLLSSIQIIPKFAKLKRIASFMINYLELPVWQAQHLLDKLEHNNIGRKYIIKKKT